jgi:hypothetical protein
VISHQKWSDQKCTKILPNLEVAVHRLLTCLPVVFIYCELFV